MVAKLTSVGGLFSYAYCDLLDNRITRLANLTSDTAALNSFIKAHFEMVRLGNNLPLILKRRFRFAEFRTRRISFRL